MLGARLAGGAYAEFALPPARALRHDARMSTVSLAELRALAGDAAFAYTIDTGWVTEDAEDDPDLSALQVYGGDDRAILRDGDEELHFIREDGGWRWDMMPTILAASTALAPDPDSEMTEDEFVMFILEYSDGRDPSPDIWQPLP